METLARAANRGSVPTGYDIDNSLKFEADNTEIIYRANESGTNRKTFTVSLWFKRTELGADQEVWHGGRNGQTTVMGILSYSSADDNLWVDVGGGTGNTGTLYRSFTTRKIRDTSAWYHFVLAVDTTQATEANRMKVWLNGEEVTDWAQHQIPAQNFQCALESGTQMAWGGYRPSNLVLFSGYLAECHYLDGVAKVQTDFGEYDEDSGIWIPKKYTGTYGNNGCYMKYNDSSALGADSSGNGNNFTLNNITSADQATDTPTNNFATYNVLVNSSTTATEGATRINSDSSFQTVPASIGVTSGKWYAEFKHNELSNEAFFGVVSLDGGNTDFGNHIGNDSDNYGVGMYAGNGNSYITGTIASFSSATSSSVVVGIALDMDNGYVYISKDGTWQNSGDPTSGSSGTGGLALAKYQTDIHAIAASCFNIASQYYVASNFGGYTTISISSAATDANGYGTFEYAPPTGYYALCTKNLAEYG